MDQIDQLFQRINKGPIDSDLRTEIADTILEFLGRKKESLGTWEKLLFAQAIAALSTNVNSAYQPADSWLRICLIALEKAMVPEDQRSEAYTNRDEQVDSITYEMLEGFVNQIKEQIR